MLKAARLLFASLVHRVADLGVRRDVPHVDARCVRLLNLLMAVTTLFVLGYAAFFLFVTPELWVVAVFGLACVPPILGLFVLHVFGRFQAARVLAPLITTVLVSFSSICIGINLNFHYFLLAILVGVFFTFPPQHSVSMYVVMPVPLAAFLIVDLVFGQVPGIYPVRADLQPALRAVASVGVATLLTGFIYYAYSVNRDSERLLAKEKMKSDQLLLNVLPESVAEQLKQNPSRIVERFESVTVLFADIAGFTPASERLTPDELIDILDSVFSQFDSIVARHGLEKIKTIGDAYMAAAGLPLRREDHCEASARAALEMLAAGADLESQTGMRMRIGMHTGPAIAGVIGRSRFIYDVWGDSVNTASRMESHGQPGRVHVTEAVKAKLNHLFDFEERLPMEVKGKGLMQTFFLLSGR